MKLTSPERMSVQPITDLEEALEMVDSALTKQPIGYKQYHFTVFRIQDSLYDAIEKAYKEVGWFDVFLKDNPDSVTLTNVTFIR